MICPRHASLLILLDRFSAATMSQKIFLQSVGNIVELNGLNGFFARQFGCYSGEGWDVSVEYTTIEVAL